MRSAGRYAMSMPGDVLQRLHLVHPEDAAVVGDDEVLLDGFVVVALGDFGGRPERQDVGLSQCAPCNVSTSLVEELEVQACG